MRRFALWTSVLIFVVLIAPTYLEACPACKNLDDPISKGFNWSILFLMAMPFTVFGLVGGTIFLHWNGYRLSIIGYRLKRFVAVTFRLPDRSVDRRLTTDD